ncbi:MAG: helix-turn-helix domain-containing protein [Pseudomonadota bacterium]
MKRRNIPNFRLYEEQESFDSLESLHCEPLEERNTVHNWKIKAHRHDQLFQIFYLSQGGGEAHIDGQVHLVLAPLHFVIPPLCVHGFEFSSDSKGFVISAFNFEVRDALSETTRLAPLFEQPVISIAESKPNPFLASLITEFQSVFRANELGRVTFLRSLLRLILIELSREIAPIQLASMHENSHDEIRFVRFMELIDQHYREHLPNEFYANRLNVTPSKLTRITKTVAGQSPHELVTNKLLLEAKRYLLYTSMNLAQITAALGMKDPAYFSRFFKTRVGMTPGRFRKQPPASQ